MWWRVVGLLLPALILSGCDGHRSSGDAGPVDAVGAADALTLPAPCADAETLGAQLAAPSEPGAGLFEGDWHGDGEIILATGDRVANGIAVFDLSVTTADARLLLTFHFANGDCSFVGERAGSEAIFVAGQRCATNPATFPTLPLTLCGGTGRYVEPPTVLFQLEAALDEEDGHMWSGAALEILVFSAEPTSL